MNSPDPLPVELLVPERARRITVDDHHRWQTTGEPPHQDDADLDELLAFTPGPVQMRKSREVSRLLSILDELEAGKDGRH